MDSCALNPKDKHRIKIAWNKRIGEKEKIIVSNTGSQ